MRTKLVLAIAALAALAACSPDKIFIRNELNNNPGGALAGSHVDTLGNGSCVRTTDILLLTSNVDLSAMPVGQTADIYVRERFVGTGCPASQSFHFTSDQPSVASVTRVDSLSGRITANSAGNAQICAVGDTDPTARPCLSVTVVGNPPPGTVSITNPALTGTSGQGCTLYVQFNAATNPAGQPVSWAKLTDHIAGGSIDNTGRFSYSAGAAGTDTVQASLASGATALGVVTVTSASCTANQCAIVNFAPTVSRVSLNVGDTVRIAPNLSTNPAGCGSVSYSASGAVSVDSSGLVTGVSAGIGYVTVTATAGGNTQSVTLSFNVSVVTSPGIDSVVVTPRTFSDTVGMQRVFTATVYAHGGASTAVNWSASNSACGTMSPSGNFLTVSWSQACSVDSIRAVAVADTTKSGVSVGAVSSGNITCDFTSNVGMQSDGSIVLTAGQDATLTGSCTNQFGVPFIPYWYVGAPPTGANPAIASILGATTTVTIAGQSWPAGPQATLHAYMAGQVTVYMQAAVTDVTVLKSRLVTVQ